MPTNDRTSLSPIRRTLQARLQPQIDNGTILKLPIELLLALFQQLDYGSLSALSATCRFFNQIVTSLSLVGSGSTKN